MGQLYCSPRLEEWNYSYILQGEGKPVQLWQLSRITLLSVPGKVRARVILSRIGTISSNSVARSRVGLLPIGQRLTALQRWGWSYKLDGNSEDLRGWRTLIFALHLILPTDNPSGYCSRPKVYPRSWPIFLRICIPIQSAVSRVDGQVSDWFSISAGVRQGCAVAPNLFLEPIDWITRRSHSPRLRAFRSQDYGDVVCQKLGISGHLSSRYRRLNSDSFFESWCMLRNVERCGNGHYCVHHCSGFVQKFDCGFHDFPGQNYFIPNYSRYFYACLYKQYN